MARSNVVYVLSTHWDREWYQTFQEFRYRLVGLIDHVLEGYRSGKLRGPFQTDGQVILLEDYLEVRPERRGEIEECLQEGQFVAGPWYVMPDGFLVSGESLIRNLRLGRDLVRRLGGKPSDAGFVCDIFGHNSQLPQIFAGFGIKGIFAWRGVNALDDRLAVWKSPDGTQLLTYIFGPIGYVDGCAKTRQSSDHQAPFNAQKTRALILQTLKEEAKHHRLRPILLFDGGDHQGWDQAYYNVLAKLMDDPKFPFKIVHGSLDNYLTELLPKVEKITQTLEGELREPGKAPGPDDYRWLIPGVLSSRVWIKQANADCQTRLCHWAEPWAAFSSLLTGQHYPQGYLDVAWKWLIQNHPHDSICGCSIDAVHEDMKYRFHQCRGIAERITVESLKTLTASVEGTLADGEIRLCVFNPLPQPLANEVVDLTLAIPADWPAFSEFFNFEAKPAFRLFDAKNRELAYQRIAQKKDQPKVRLRYAKFPQGYQTHEVTVAVELSVPALGYTTLTVRADEKVKLIDGIVTSKTPIRHPEVPGLATSERSMANAFLDVTIESNGTVTLTDKRTGQTYHRLLTFEDTADIGDGWYHGPAVNDQTFVSTAAQCDVALVHNNPLLATFRVRTALNVPEEFRFDTMTRSDRLIPLVIDNHLTLRKGSNRLEVQTVIHNPARDHRLRVLLPSGARTDTYLADSPFDVVERPIALRKDNHAYRELEIEAKPQQSWTAVFDENRGLAVLSDGLFESAVRDLPDRPIAVTLFRSTRRTVFTAGEPEGQLLGDLKFHYAIAPLAGSPDRAKLFLHALKLAAGVKAVQLDKVDLSIHPRPAVLPREEGLLTLEGDAVLTSLRTVNGAMELRLFNPMPRDIEATIRLNKRLGIQQAVRVNFESRPVGEEKKVTNGTLSLKLNVKQVMTVRLGWVESDPSR